jgi:hypothetical protein
MLIDESYTSNFQGLIVTLNSDINYFFEYKGEGKNIQQKTDFHELGTESEYLTELKSQLLIWREKIVREYGPVDD